MEKAPSLNEMPNEILVMIAEQVDLSSKRNLRLTSRRLRKVVDAVVSFKVVLNNSTEKTVQSFSPSITSLVVGYYDKPMKTMSSSRSWLSNKSVKELVLTGRCVYEETKVSTNKKPFIYPYLPNEVNVDVHVANWLSLGIPSKGIPQANLMNIIRLTGTTVTRLYLSSNVIVDIGLKQLGGISTHFPFLKAFEFLVIHHDNAHMKAQVNVAIQALFKNRFPGLQRIGFGMKCHCQKLGFQHAKKFFAFLVAHKETVTELRLEAFMHFCYREFLRFDTEAEELVESIRTVQLKKLYLAFLPNTIYYIYNYHLYEYSFEIELLRNQRELEVLRLDMTQTGSAQIFNFIPEIPTLKACSINGYYALGGGIVNCGFLQSSRDLKVLELMCRQDLQAEFSLTSIEGIENLPKTLEQLSLSMDLTARDAMWIEENLTNLTHIRYYGGIRRAIDGTRLSQTIAGVCTFNHMKLCMVKMPRLTDFELGIRKHTVILEMVNDYLIAQKSELRFDLV